MLPSGFEPESLAISNLYRKKFLSYLFVVRQKVRVVRRTRGIHEVPKPKVLVVALCHYFFRQRFLAQ